MELRDDGPAARTRAAEGVLGRITTAWAGHKDFAMWLVARLRAETTVDLGVDFGFSSFCFALPGIGHVYGIDSFEGDAHAGFRDTYQEALRGQRELGLGNLTFIRGLFADVAKTWNRRIDILHVDGNHAYEAVKADLSEWARFMKPSGVVLLHDTCVGHFGVRQVFDEIPYPKLNFHQSHGLGVVSPDAALIREIAATFPELVEAGSVRLDGSAPAPAALASPPISQATARMEPMTLWSDFQQHRGRLIHKWDQYFPAYERHFARFRNQAVTVVELGAGEGGSLELWQRFFGPYARIVGIDRNPAAKASEGQQVSVRIGDQTDTAFLDSVLAEFGPVQIIIDDGSHVMPHIHRSFAHLYHHPRFDPNGVYLVEDLHTAYWPEFGGGYRREGSFIETAKAQIDELHAHHARGAFQPTPFTSATLSMHIYDSMVVYERGRRGPNQALMADSAGVRPVRIAFRHAPNGD